MFSPQTSRRVVLLMSILALSACGSDRSNGPDGGALPSLSFEFPAGDWYPGDVTTLHAVLRDATGVIVPNAPITWEVSSASRAEVASGGATTFLAPGAVTITARSGTLSASQTIQVRVLNVKSVTILPSELQLRRGDVGLLGVRVQGEGGRDVLGRAVTITSDNPAVASIDGSGRVHAVTPGVTTVRATADGVVGTARIEIVDRPATYELSRVGGGRLPNFIVGDSVMWNGERQYHEVFLEGGTLVLSGGTTPTYTIDIRYAQYHVSGPPGRRSYTLVLVTHDRDFGTVERDARGDFRLTSSFVAPLQHTATAVGGGIQVHFRIAGDDEFLDLLYIRD